MCLDAWGRGLRPRRKPSARDRRTGAAPCRGGRARGPGHTAGNSRSPEARRRSAPARRTKGVGSWFRRRQDASARLAEADRRIAFARTTTTLDDLVAVLEKRPRLTARQLERILAGEGEFHERA